MKELTPEVLHSLASQHLPLAHRKQMAIDLMADENYTEQMLQQLAAPALDQEAKEMAAEIKGIVANLQRAPMKPASFIELSTLDGSASPIAVVAMDDGQIGYMVVHDSDAAKKLKLGDRVALDGKAKILIGKALDDVFQYGKEARFERRLNTQHIEVTSREEKMVVLTHRKLMDKIESGAVKPGDSLVIAPGDRIATIALPETDSLTFCRFLDRGPVPNVVVARDIGSPPRVIEVVAKHVKEEMTRPALRRRFRLRPCITRLLCGVSGSGKTLAVQAIHRLIYDIMSEVTDTPVEKLPQRVFRFKTSQILSMWLGESDKNADRLFDEVEKLAGETFTNKKGKEFTLPVMVVMEEAEGMGRARGGDRDGIYDRILTTLLQRLDPNRSGLADRLVVFLSTTNEPHLVDPAFLRRIGGQVEHFGRLDRPGFVDVLKKHVEGLPAADGTGKSQRQLWRENLMQLEEWLYSEENDLGVVELSVKGGSSLVKYHRDFLTGALIDRAVQESSSSAWEESLINPEAGITVGHLKGAIAHQIKNVVKQLTPQNVSHYLDLPEGTTVSQIRSLSRS